ncbi:hypothetical protein I350_00065 [Cryptococcus amylolentus CBS 6273]|uniref:GST N-terminal domain-containing protein n=1 Tax=Cryptococcus amylolentus CBS 6273 TaxID=1296118 RepID=A0A1E3KDX7_9TREE|nr:hypothetical protein I350_00065 [Cryptococcus amylolentus CBS 6273]
MPDISAFGRDLDLEFILNEGGRWAHSVHIALEEAKLPYKLTHVDLNNKPDWLLKANPLGLVPILAVGSPPIYLTESADIVSFIVATTPSLQPSNELQRAQSFQIAKSALALLSSELLPIIGKQPSEAVREIHHKNQLKAIRKVQELLHATGPYALGERFTEADVLLAPFVGRLWAYGVHGIAPAGDRTTFSIERLKKKIAQYEVSQSKSEPKYPRFLPEPFDPNEVFIAEPPFEHIDRGLSADPNFPDLLPTSARVEHLTPVIGTEVRGVQLSKLSDEGRDQLALYVAQRGVVVFRGQDFRDLEPEQQLEFVRYFGPHYLHPSDRHPKDLPQYYSIFQDSNDRSVNNTVNPISNKLTSITWHTDGSSELQPPGLTLLFSLENPRNGGGDTLFTSTVEAYERLSEEYRARLEGLEAEHYLPYEPRRRDAPRSIHPLIRTHPVTKKKILFANEVITRRIIGFRREESDNLLSFLTGHIARGQDFACRVKWEEGTVVVWDNRSTQHTATTNFPADERRHLCRITSIAERPV